MIIKLFSFQYFNTQCFNTFTIRDQNLQLCRLEKVLEILFWFCACGLQTLRFNSQNSYKQMRYSTFFLLGRYRNFYRICSRAGRQQGSFWDRCRIHEITFKIRCCCIQNVQILKACTIFNSEIAFALQISGWNAK